ncbi:MAG: hypothetical protein RMJ31_05450 [Nitrososphaerota archaeon]|nr:hypothetical protein [Nitrososphaerales archaeon]MDW8045202.1 hypothetical protein [Nitrososphaerota archaeon]
MGTVKKEYIVTEISAAPDGGPYVLVSLTDPRDLTSTQPPRFGQVAIGFTSIEDLMKNLQRAIAGLSRQAMGGVVTVIKLDMREYEESGLKVGDKVYLEISKVEREGV